MSARNTLHTPSPYTHAPNGGPIDFAGNALNDAAFPESPAPRPGLLLRATLVATVCFAAVASFAAVVSPPKAHLSGTLFEQTIAAGLGQPQQMAIDSKGNLYVADIINNAVYKLAPVNGVYVTTVFRDNLNGPEAVAVDSKDNIYIGNSDNQQVLKETLDTTNGKYVETTVTTTGLGGISCQIAVDADEDVYIADCINNRVLKIPYDPGTRSYTAQTVLPATGLLDPQGVAVDAKFNVYIADSTNNRIVELAYSNGNYTQSVILSGGFNEPAQISLVGTQTLLVADSLNDRIEKVDYDATTKVWSESTVTTGPLNSPIGVVADAQGNIFIADTNNKRIAEDTASLSANFGPWPVNTTSATATLTFTFDSGGKLGAPTVALNKGFVDSAKYTNLASSTCASNVTILTGDTCTIQLTFEPLVPGFSFGAVELRESSTNVLVQVPLSGIGLGPKAIFAANPSESSVASQIGDPVAVAYDSAGNVYVADYKGNQILKETPSSSGTYTQTVIPLATNSSPAIDKPSAIAVDVAGDIFVTILSNFGSNTVLPGVVELTPPTGTSKDYTVSVVCQEGGGTGLVEPNCGGEEIPGPIAFDSQGNLWVSSTGMLQQFTLSTSGHWVKGNYLVVTVSSGGKNYESAVDSLAIDAWGNIYVGVPATTHNKAEVLEYGVQPDGSFGQSIVEQGFGPAALAVDAIGNLFVSDNSNLNVYSPVPGGFTATSLATVSPLNKANGLAVDAKEKLYIANSQVGNVLAESWNSPPKFTFANTQVNTTSPAVTHSILNIGSGPFDWTVPSAGQNPETISQFLVNDTSSGDCPALTPSSEPDPLPAGSSCLLSVSFSPTSTGPISGSIGYTYNLSSTSTSSLVFQASGSAIETVPIITWPAPASIVYGTALSAEQLDAAASFDGQTVPGTFTYTPALGTVLGAGTQKLSVQFTPSVSGYSSTSATAQIQVTPAPLFIVADSFSRVYGSPNPALTLSYIGFVNGDGPQSLSGAAVITEEATPQFPWGYYPIVVTQGNLNSPNYAFTFVDGTLVITQAPLTVTAQNVTVSNSSEIPDPYPCTITGFVNGDTASVVSGACATNVQNYSNSPSGSYTVTPTLGTLSALNYTFTNFTAGTLTISPSQTVTTIGSGFDQPEGIAVDANGNVYVADVGFSYIVKETLASGTFTQSDVGSTDYNQFGVAVDGSGNLYVTASGANEVWELAYANGSYSQTVIADSDSGVSNPWGIAVDGNGNVFVANIGNSNVIKLTPAGDDEWSVSTIASSSGQGLNEPKGLAVDGNGNVYIVDSVNERVVIMNNSAGTYSLSKTVFSGFDEIDGVAVDKNGNVYISDAGKSTIYKETLANSTYTQSTVHAAGLISPGDVAVDANGNVYITDTGNARVLEVPASGSQNSGHATPAEAQPTRLDRARS